MIHNCYTVTALGHEPVECLATSAGHAAEAYAREKFTQQPFQLTCAVHDECRSWSLSRPDPVPGGVAGGLDYRQRGRLRQRLRGAGTADRGICGEVNWR